MRTLIRLYVAASMLLFWFPMSHAGGLTGQELGQHCLAMCQVAGKGLRAEEIASPDICVGYVKAIISAMREYPLPGKTREVNACTAKLLSPRTAESPDEDEMMIAACDLGLWVSARPSLQQRPASAAVLLWAGATSCAGE